MDLSAYTKSDDQVRTIFEDAEHFAKSYSYKLLPITFESVDETIIHIEHNYCHWKPSDEPESNESQNSATHEEVEERNYKKRKIKSLATDNNDTSEGCETEGDKSLENLSPDRKCEEVLSNQKVDENCCISVQPLDLSLPLLQEQKTDKMLTENQSNIPKIKSDTKNSSDKKQLNLHESNKENVTNTSKKIEVTISRPGQKGYYEPCEVFLNDLARISPDLIKNDCHEIEIIDRTHSQDFQEEVNRTYYIVLESTWRIFENSTERIVLTNDLNIGQPVQNSEKYDKPRYLIFDQYSLTESLANICESKGGSFEYTCLEEQEEEFKIQDNEEQELIEILEDHGTDCINNDGNFEAESDRPESTHCDSNINKEGKEKVSDDCAVGLGSTNYLERILTENSYDKLNYKDKGKTEELHPNNPTNDKEFPEISEVPFVLADKDTNGLEDESEVCDCNSLTEPVKSVELNLVLSEPVNVSTESKEIDNDCFNSGSTSTEGATELKRELVNEEKCASDLGSGKATSFSQPELKGTKRVKVSEENNCAISGKAKKFKASVEVQNIIENEKVQNNPENVNKQEKTEEDPYSSSPLAGFKDSPLAGKEKVIKDDEKIMKSLPKNRSYKERAKNDDNMKTKGKSLRMRKKIGCTDIKTRSKKEVSVLRNGKQRCAPSRKAATNVKQGRKKTDSVTVSKLKPEKKEEKLKRRGRTRKSTPEGSKKICLRKRI